MLDASVNRVLHTPTTRLREAAADQSLEGPAFGELAQAVDRLFALGEELDEMPDSGGGDSTQASDPGAARATPSSPPASRSGIAKVGSR
jgi:hypothetical protein